MVRDDAIDRIAMDAAIAYETARGWQVEELSADNKGFDLLSSKFGAGNADTPIDLRYIEVKGRANVGLVLLSQHEYNTAYRLKQDYWLYTVFNCATTPEVHTVCNPVHLLEAFITQYPEAVEERFQRGGVHKVVILGKPVERDGQVFDYKMMLTEYVRQRANAADLAGFIDLLVKARKCMALKA